MKNTNPLDKKTAKEKAAYVTSKVAYWPKSMVARFAEMEKNIQSEREENAKFRATVLKLIAKK